MVPASEAPALLLGTSPCPTTKSCVQIVCALVVSRESGVGMGFGTAVCTDRVLHLI